jgi:starch-binding outer membrane protein, SusD/RagB family
MHAFNSVRTGASRRRRVRAVVTAVTLLGALGSVSCEPTEFLQITDPDIINPSDVSSAAGAQAARQGALARLNAATSGVESLLLLGGLFTDEWNNGDSFIARQEIDQRVITPQNDFLTTANRNLHRARLSAQQALDLLRQFSPTAPGWQLAEMYFVEAYVESLAAEHYCSGLVFSTVVNGEGVYGSPMTTVQALTMALAHADSGLALITGTTADDVKIRSALQVVKGRILLDLNRPADAATAVTGVATNFQYLMFHALTANSNQYWNLNNSAGRYSVSNNEGTNGLNFATANDPRVPTCQGNDATCRTIGVTKASRDDLTTPFWVQRIWPARESSVPLVAGVEARLIEAEAQLRAGSTTASLATLNALRATFTGLTPLTDAGTEAARVDQLFRERAFTLFGRGTRTGDMRRLIRQYNRPAASVFPVGAWHKGGNYGGDVTLPLPLAEQNNPNVPNTGACIDRNA